MNKKTKVFSFVLSIIMILVLSIGTTLALLTRETAPVKNTFTAVTDLLADDSTFEIQEHKVDANFALTGDLATPDQNGAYVTYNGLFPGTIVAKDPTVKLSKLAAGAYLYVVIEQSNMSAGEDDGDLFNWSVSADWTELGTAGNQTLYVLKDGAGAMALTAGDDTDYSFEILDGKKVYVENYESNVDEDLTSGYMTFKAYLVQSYGVTADTAETARTVFNDTFGGVDFANN